MKTNYLAALAAGAMICGVAAPAMAQNTAPGAAPPASAGDPYATATAQTAPPVTTTVEDDDDDGFDLGWLGLLGLAGLLGLRRKPDVHVRTTESPTGVRPDKR